MQLKTRCLTAILLLMAASGFGKTIYVKQTATSGGNGNLWASAYSNLQTAIDNANSGDQIWVCTGTYKPTKFIDEYAVTDLRSRAFMLKGGVAIYGGFSGNENLLNQRNSALNPVILSGDFSSNDSTSWPPDSSRSENAYHVAVALKQVGLILVDGIFFTGGNANNTIYEQPENGSVIPSGAYPHCEGSGLLAAWSNLSINNCTFEKNSSSFGGSVWLYGGAPYYGATYSALISNSKLLNNLQTAPGSCGAVKVKDNISVRISETTFTGNKASNGGGVSSEVNDDSYAPRITILKCVFNENQARMNPDSDLSGYLDDGQGGAIFVSDNAKLYIASCAFVDNRVDPNNLPSAMDNGMLNGQGGAISADGGAEIKIATSIFVGNRAEWAAGAIQVASWGSAPTGSCEIYFCTICSNTSRWGGGINSYRGLVSGYGNIFYNNKSIDGNGYISDITGSVGSNYTYNISNSLTTKEEYWWNSDGTPSLKAGNPEFDDIEAPFGKDDIFSTFDDGLKIMGASDATKCAGNNRPPDFCDIDNDGNTSELLPLDAEGVAYESTGPYHAGAYQRLGNPKSIHIHLDVSKNANISFTRNKGGTESLAPYIYMYEGVYQTVEFSYDLQNWFPADFTGMQVTPISGKAFEFCENIAFAKSTSSTPKAFYRIKYNNTAPSVFSPNPTPFSYSLSAPGEGYANSGFFPALDDPQDSFEAICFSKLNLSATANYGIPLLNPVLFFNPISQATFDAGGNVAIRINGTVIADIEFNSKYHGQSFGIRLSDTGQILTFDSLGQELKFPPPNPIASFAVYDIVVP